MISTVAPLARLAAAVAFATASLAAHAGTFSLARTGNLVSDASIEYVDFTLGSVSDMLAWTSSASVSFDTLLSLFSRDSGALLTLSDDVDNPFPLVALGQSALDAGIAVTDLAPGAYRLVISASPNAPAGALWTDGFTVPVATGSIPGDWALDLAVVEAQPVPEPQTWAILGAGLALVGALRRPRKTAAA
jgi:hypothetical protein